MKVGEHSREQDKLERCECKTPIALLITYNRPGLLLGTVDSFLKTTKDIPLVVFDDGSTDQGKKLELNCLDDKRVTLVRLPHLGFAGGWMAALEMAKEQFSKFHDSVIMLEDDLVFARGWVEVLQKMQKGIADRGWLQGMTTCFMPHNIPQSEVMNLGGVEAYQSMAHSWHVNMMPMSVLNRFDVFTDSMEEVLRSRRGLGLDVYYVGNLAHKLKRMSFVSTQSWAAHVGFDSMVKGQGFGSYRHCGFNLVKELEGFANTQQWCKGEYEKGQSRQGPDG